MEDTEVATWPGRLCQAGGGVVWVTVVGVVVVVGRVGVVVKVVLVVLVVLVVVVLVVVVVEATPCHYTRLCPIENSGEQLP